MLAVRGSHAFAGLAGRFGDHPRKVRAANSESPLIISSERMRREKPCCQRGLLSAQGFKKITDESQFFQLLSGGAGSVSDFYKVTHGRKLDASGTNAYSKGPKLLIYSKSIYT